MTTSITSKNSAASDTLLSGLLPAMTILVGMMSQKRPEEAAESQLEEGKRENNPTYLRPLLPS